MPFRRNFWAAFLLSALTLVFITAGVWQMGRARYKDTMQANVEAAAIAPPMHAGSDLLDANAAHLRRLEARGVWVPERTILLDNKVQQGVIGYEVVTPLRIADSQHYLLVNRGWVRAPQLRSELPQIMTPTGSVAIEGVARIPSNRFIELGEQVVTGAVWQNLTIERYQAWSHISLQPVMLYQSGGDDDGLRRVEAAPEAAGINADRHRGYALTWFSFAGVTVVLGLLGWRKSKRKLTN